MKSLHLLNKGTLAISEKPAPVPGINQHLVRILACGLCRTDAKIFMDGHRDLILPRIIGHEICGIDTSNGRRVVIWPGISCGTCVYCLGGHENLCNSIGILGFNRDGGLSEHIAADVSSLFPVPDNLTSYVATLAEPFACALNAYDKIRIKNRIIIFGAGTLGLILAFLASKDKKAFVSIVETDIKRCDMAGKILQGTGIQISQEVPEEEIFDAAINATSSSDAFVQAIKSLKRGGEMCFFSGLSKGTVSFPVEILNEVHYRELSIAGAYGCNRVQMRGALTIIEEESEFAGNIISGILPLEETERGLRNILKGEGLKWVVKMTE